jgi:hypothetical protein
MNRDSVLSLFMQQKINIFQCQELAKEVETKPRKTLEFDFCGPKAKFHCKWLDPYIGFFTIDEQIIRVQDVMCLSDLWCENHKIVDKEK